MTETPTTLIYELDDAIEHLSVLADYRRHGSRPELAAQTDALAARLRARAERVMEALALLGEGEGLLLRELCGPLPATAVLSVLETATTASAPVEPTPDLCECCERPLPDMPLAVCPHCGAKFGGIPATAGEGRQNSISQESPKG